MAGEALRDVADGPLFEALCETRDLAYEQLIAGAAKGSAQWRKWIDQSITEAEAALDYARALKTVTAYYAGRAQERAGNLKAAEARYRECLRERPSRLLWDFEVGRGSCGPVLADGVVYACSRDGNLRAFEGSTGTVLWAFRADDCVSTPVVAEGVVYARVDARRLRAFAAKTGKPLWEFVAPGRVYSTVIADGRAYVAEVRAEQTHHLWALEADTGKVLWDFTAAGWVSSLVAAGGVAFVGSRDGGVRALDAVSGEPLWDRGNKLPGVTRASDPSVALVAEGVVCAVDVPPGPAGQLGHLRVLEARTGKVLWDLASVWRLYPPAAMDGVVYAGGHGWTPAGLRDQGRTDALGREDRRLRGPPGGGGWRGVRSRWIPPAGPRGQDGQGTLELPIAWGRGVRQPGGVGGSGVCSLRRRTPTGP